MTGTSGTLSIAPDELGRDDGVRVVAGVDGDAAV